MSNILSESLIVEYFMFKSVLGKYFKAEEILLALKEIFCIENDELFAFINDGCINSINSLEDYKRYQRIKQYRMLTQQSKLYNDEQEIIISLLGKALVEATKFNIFASEEMTHSLIAQNLTDSSKRGNIIAMRILGILKVKGIFFPEDKDCGMKLLHRATKWGDVIANLAILVYCNDNKDKYYKMLNSSIEGTVYEGLINKSNDNKDDEILLIKKAIVGSKIDKNVYDPVLARLIFNDVIGIKDKERIIFSETRINITEACDLPLKLKFRRIDYDINPFIKMPFFRPKEQQSILEELKNINNRYLYSYKSICLYSDSDRALNDYIMTLKKMFITSNVEVIDCINLNEKDFCNNKNNIFLRSVNEDKNNIFILLVKGDVKNMILDNIKAFINTEKRSKFHLFEPYLTLNLSSILPICICDKENMTKIKSLVEVIKVENIIDIEKPQYLNYLIHKINSNLVISEEALKELSLLSLDKADKILLKCITDNKNIKEVTYDILKEYIKDKKYESKGYGFGGIIYEND